ncbi:ATP-dependent nuclease [Treponema pectinovorum]|uniref:ATP-dependent nuclease n=1 Tax=Treponema pectinovorum TaxID=164 RepID=UPI0011C74F9A|nr:ATP-binding protein [Treponema pectinovorum]
MKLKKLYIKDYKNLKDFKLDFENDNGFSIIVGNNGSGKSNILEAISGIFCEWYGKVKYTFPCDYSLSYDYDGRIITLKREGKEKFFFENEFLYDDSSCFWLPSNVIALYSGEDMRLWEHLYMPTYLQYFKDLISGQSGRMCMYYVNKYLWNISLFTMLLFASELTDIADFLKDEIGIKNIETDVHNILISFDFKNYNKNNNPLVKSFIDKINPDHKSEIGNTLESWKSIINDFGNSNDIFNLLMQSFMPKDYKIITNIEIIFNGNLTLESLSEGEKKLILTKAVLEFVADENSLLLFDEPDANIHEARKTRFYDILKKYDNRQFVITSHSPIFVELADENELIFIRKNKDNIEVVDVKKHDEIIYLTGNRISAFYEKPILYCEGNEVSSESIEPTLFRILFPNFYIVPCGGHDEVIHNTKMYNRTFNPENFAIGIIDGDYISSERREVLTKDQIFSLPLLEVENLLLDNELLKNAKQNFCSDEDSIDKIYKEIEKDVKTPRRENMAIKYAKAHTVSKIVAEVSEDGETLDDFKSNLQNLICGSVVDNLHDDFNKRIDNYINTNNYESLIKDYDFNHNIDRFAKPIVEQYTKRVIRYIQRDKNIQDLILNKYFSQINDYLSKL